MFDNIEYECDCPTCGQRVTDFQSKDGDCALDNLKPEQVTTWYSSCDKCRTWIEFKWVVTHKMVMSFRPYNELEVANNKEALRSAILADSDEDK